MNSSITTVLPASPKRLPLSISSTAALASSTFIATTTPLPAANPSAFTTIGAPVLAMNCFASSALENTPYAAVGILYFFISSLAKTLEPSN